MDGFSLNLCVKYFVGRSHVFPTVGTKNVTLREIMRWRHTRTSSLFVTITWVLFVAQYLGFLSSEFTKSTSVNWKIVQRYIARSCSQLLRLHGVSGSSVNKCRVVIHWHWHMKRHNTALPTTISHRLAWDRTRVSAVSGRQVSVWGM